MASEIVYSAMAQYNACLEFNTDYSNRRHMGTPYRVSLIKSLAAALKHHSSMRVLVINNSECLVSEVLQAIQGYTNLMVIS